MKRSLVAALASTMLLTALSGCIVAPAPGYAAVVAYEAPPPLRYEVVGVAPAPGYFWVSGAWFYSGGHYRWHGGYWEAPRPGYHWVPHAWTRESNAWAMHPGRWERVHG